MEEIQQVETITDEDTEQVLYDAAAIQRFARTIPEAGETYKTAHIYKPLTDERYLRFLETIKIEGEGDGDERDDLQGASVQLWKDLIDSIENIEVSEGQDFRELADTENEIIPSINDYLVVAVVEPETISTAARKLGVKTNQTVTTEAYFNGKPHRQTHTLLPKSDELSKKFDRIQRRRFKQETTKGLTRKAKIYYIPQDKAKGVLYDDMFVDQSGFLPGFTAGIPLRFKSAVIDYVFSQASTLDPK